MISTFQGSDRYLRVGRIAAVLAMVVVTIALSGRMFGVPILTKFVSGALRMSIASGCVFLLLGAAALVGSFGALSRRARWFIYVSACAGAAVAGAVLFEWSGTLVSNPDLAGALKAGMARVHRLGLMSPITAMTHVLSAIALVCLTIESARRRLAEEIAANLAAAVILLNLIVLVSYWYRTPVFYGGAILPVAPPSALAFTSFGLSLLALAGPDTRLAQLFAGNSLHSRLLRTFLPTVVFIVLVQGWIDSLLSRLGAFKPVIVTFLAAAISATLVTAAVYLIAGRIGSTLERARSALEDSEARFRVAFDQAAVGMVLVGLSGRFLRVNGTLYEMLGYRIGELLGLQFRDITHPEDIGMCEEAMRRMLAGELPRSSGERRYLHKQGFPVWVQVSLNLAHDAAGQPLYFITQVQDITARKRSEESLRRTGELLEAVYRAAPVAIVATDLNGATTMWNGAAERIFGWKAEEVIGGPLPIVQPDKQAEFKAHRETAAAGDTVHGEELTRQRKDGCFVEVSLWTAPLRDPSGAITGLIEVLMDITEGKRTARALEASEERFRLVVENAPEGIFVQTGGCFRYVNRAALELFGSASPEDLTGQSVLERVAAEYRERVQERIHQLNEERFAVPMLEEKFLRMDGTPFETEVIAVPFTFLNRDGAVVFFRDISERKRAEEERMKLEAQFLQAQKMESVGRLAGGVAHDFNNHLTVINGYCELMLARLDRQDPLRASIGEVRRAGERAATLTQQLLAFSRKQVIEPKVVDLNSVISEIGGMLRRIVGEDIELHMMLAADIGQIIADGGQVHQVLMNLVVNARDAMPGGGKLIVETTNVDLDSMYAASHLDVKPGSYVLLAVTDTGIGMDTATQQHIFEPFFTTKEKGSGTGLGLSTVYGIVRQAGGWIWVYSEPGKGTSFKIYLPRVEEGERPELTRQVDVGSLRGAETILVVEDQDDVRKLAIEVLKGFGYHVLGAANGGDAILLCERYTDRIDLMVTDVVMPGMTGRELGDRLAAIKPEMKVLFVSGYTANVISSQGVLDEGVAYLAKPFTPDALGAKVREVLAKRGNSAT